SRPAAAIQQVEDLQHHSKFAGRADRAWLVAPLFALRRFAITLLLSCGARFLRARDRAYFLVVMMLCVPRTLSADVVTPGAATTLITPRCPEEVRTHAAAPHSRHLKPV